MGVSGCNCILFYFLLGYIKHINPRSTESTMSIYREKQTGSDDTSAVETIRAGCPICKTDVKGNDVYLFFCKKCNILFKREELFSES